MRQVLPVSLDWGDGSPVGLILPLSPLVARGSLCARAKENVSRDCGSCGPSDFRGYLVHHRLA
jgi:hypothetical protein